MYWPLRYQTHPRPVRSVKWQVWTGHKMNMDKEIPEKMTFNMQYAHAVFRIPLAIQSQTGMITIALREEL